MQDKYIIPKVDKTEEIITIGRYFFSVEKAKTSYTCYCGNRVKKGDKRLHIGGYNNINSGSVCMVCANKLANLIKEEG